MVNIKKFLNENADLKYADFNKKFIFSNYAILGVRTPLLKKFAKDLEPEYIELSPALSHEEILLYGFSAGNMKNENEQLEYLSNILPYIDNWATCDLIVPTLKMTKGQKSYDYYTKLLQDEREFYCRVGIIGLMRFFIKTDKIDEILKNIKNIKQQDYYVKMATAWFYAELCVFNYQKAKIAIENSTDKFIRNKAISKAKESFRVNSVAKEELETLRMK